MPSRESELENALAATRLDLDRATRRIRDLEAAQRRSMRAVDLMYRDLCRARGQVTTIHLN